VENIEAKQISWKYGTAGNHFDENNTKKIGLAATISVNITGKVIIDVFFANSL